MSVGDQQLIGLLEKAELTNSHRMEEQGPPKEITIRDSEVDRLMVGMVLDIPTIKTLVIKYQNPEHGFYCYEDWLRLHEVIFECRTDAVVQMWRILKLINFGDDYLPTGLIFDCLVTLFNIEAKSEESERTLRALFFRFIQINGKQINDKERDEIEYLKQLKRIVESYKEMITKKLKEGYVSDRNSKDRKPRYETLHELHNIYTYKKNLKRLKKIDEEFRQCSFEPELLEYRKQVESRYLTSTSKTFDLPQEEELFETRLFRASPIPDYPDIHPKGFTPHISRMKDYMELRHTRSMNKPILSPNSSRKVEQFSIVERSKQRKENSLKNRPVLFLIEAEIGKRRFQIKVREGMTQEQVVQQIEMLAGFSDPDIPVVVEQYFMNYFRRVNNIEI